MTTIEIYHGSPCVVRKPELAKGRPYNDYGQGFYCTRDKDLACEWACDDSRPGGIVNTYAINLEGLNVVNLDDNPHGVLGWAATLMKYRKVNMPATVNRAYVDRFIGAYAQNLDDADIVEGFRADDSYYDIIRAFAGNQITDKRLLEAFQLGNLGRQIVLKSRRAFEVIEFVGAETVPSDPWAKRRLTRNSKANDQFFAMLQAPSPYEGKLFSDIVVELEKGQ